MMKTYFYCGEYTEPKWQELLVSSKEGDEYIKNSVVRFGGSLMSSFLLSPIGYVQFPDDACAFKWVQSISKHPGVQSFELFHTENASETQAQPFTTTVPVH